MIHVRRVLEAGAIVLLAAFGCSTPQPAAVEEDEAVVVTEWTRDFELFMEYPQLRVGEAADFAAHLTHLPTFEPVTRGAVRFQYSKDGQTVGERVLEAPLRAGLYVPEFTFTESGRHVLRIEIESPDGSGAILVDPLDVHEANDSLAPVAEIAVQGDRISYLKEQQWKLPFRTELAGVSPLRASILVSGVVAADPDRDFQVLPPVAGRFVAGPDGVPVVGQQVKKGQLLGFVEPPLPATELAMMESNQVEAQATYAQLQGQVFDLEARVVELESRLELARQEHERVQRLFEMQAVSSKRVGASEQEVTIIEANLAATRSNFSSMQEALTRLGARSTSVGAEQRIAVQAPGDGTIVASHGSPGAFVEQNTALFRVTDLSEVWIRADVPEGEIHQIRGATEGVISLTGGPTFELGGPGSRLIAVGDVVDPETRTIPLIWSISNSGRELKVGMLLDVRVFAGGEVTGLAVPSSAVFREDNKKIVYVHVSGETFDRRIVQTSAEDGGITQILDGLAEGERIVVEGGYEVGLAARSSGGAASAGHVH